MRRLDNDTGLVWSSIVLAATCLLVVSIVLAVTCLLMGIAACA